MPKSNSTAGFEKQGDDKGQNSAGNVIHITVNNYITNNTITTVKPEEELQKTKGSQSMGELIQGPSVILKSNSSKNKQNNDGTSRSILRSKFLMR